MNAHQRRKARRVAARSAQPRVLLPRESAFKLVLTFGESGAPTCDVVPVRVLLTQQRDGVTASVDGPLPPGARFDVQPVEAATYQRIHALSVPETVNRPWGRPWFVPIPDTDTDTDTDTP